MRSFEGKSVYKGIATGPVAVIRKKSYQVERQHVESVHDELLRFFQAVDIAKEQLNGLYHKAEEKVGETGAAIFEMHKMMLEDEEYKREICKKIECEKVNSEYAVKVTGEAFFEFFAAMPDDYMRARAADVLDVSLRLIRNLQGYTETENVIDTPSIVLADDLSPSDTVQMEKEKILAFVMRQGSSNSHTAILARMMNIPALVQTDFLPEQVEDGAMAIVDGFEGKFILEPSLQALENAQRRRKAEQDRMDLLKEFKGLENETIDGAKIEILANIGNVTDIDDVIENDAGGIGLFRSEFLYLGRSGYPTEEEQFEAYSQVLMRMKDKPVIIRTLDIGADKKEEYFGLKPEENPAMGYRGIRFCKKNPEVFKTQLRALFRAAVYGDLAIMYPMIISLQEIEFIERINKEVCLELDEANISYKVPRQGVMIETPAAAMISDLLADRVDFFSIGTNDLSQYTLAIDRQNAQAEEFFEPYHEAVIRMIQLTVENAHAHDIKVGICGELASDTKMTECFLRLGVDELSVAPSMVLRLRKKVRETQIK